MIDERLTIIAYSSVLLFIVAIALTAASGLGLAVAIAWNALLVLDIEYYKLPLSTAENPFIVAASVIDVIVFTLLAVWLASLFFEFIKGLGIRERFQERRIRGFKGHVIITNMNKLGELVSVKLKEKGIRHVFIVQSQEELEKADEIGVFAIIGNPTMKETLIKAGINNAAHLIACGEDDIKNSMIAISAKAIDSKIKIITRVAMEENIPKLSRSGVYKCIMPEATAGDSMAESIISAYS
ncbi:MAG: NAD(P)-binding protein [Methanothrix sp.]